MQEIFEYTDYRKILADFHALKKDEKKGYSYLAMANDAGYKSNSFIIDVVRGRKNLGRKNIFRFAKVLGLTIKEREYFESLVMLADSKEPAEKQFYFEKIKSFGGKDGSKNMELNQYEYFSKWYHAVIREIITLKSYRGGMLELAKMVRPRITVEQARESVKLLKKLGIIKKLTSGRYKHIEKGISTGNEIQSLAVLRYQQEHLKIAHEALESIPQEDRDISTLTGGISEKCYQTIKIEIQRFRKEIVQLIHDDKREDRIYQFNFQFYPVSQLPKKKRVK